MSTWAQYLSERTALGVYREWESEQNKQSRPPRLSIAQKAAVVGSQLPRCLFPRVPAVSIAPPPSVANLSSHWPSRLSLSA